MKITVQLEEDQLFLSDPFSVGISFQADTEKDRVWELFLVLDICLSNEKVPLAIHETFKDSESFHLSGGISFCDFPSNFAVLEIDCDGETLEKFPVEIKKIGEDWKRQIFRD